jgi:hypothetical protein
MDMKRILQAMDGVSAKPLADSNDMKRFLQVVTEGSNPHKVALPVQMAMQHYAEVKEAPAVKEDKLFKLPETSKLYTYYETAEKKVTEQNIAKKAQISETARSIAKRVLAKEKNAPVVKESLDYEGSMAKEQLISMAHHALELAKMMDENTQLDAWVQSKITVASDYIQTVGDFLKYGHQEVDNDEQSVSEGTWDDKEFRNRERNAGLEHETNNIAIAINGKTWKVVQGKGYADSREEREYLHHMQRWAEKKSTSSGKKWSVHLTGANPTVDK